MEFIRTGITGKLMLGGALCMVLMGSQCDGTQQSNEDTATQTVTAAAEPVAAEPIAPLLLQTAWPQAAIRVDVPQADNLTAKNVVLVIDASGSMEYSCNGEEKIVTARAAARTYLDQVPAEVNLGLVTFRRESGTVQVSLGPNNHAAVREALETFEVGSATPMSRGIDVAYQELVRAGSAQLGYGEYHMVILADGQPGIRDGDNEVELTIAALDELALQTPISITTIGFCTELRETLDRPGTFYYPANDLDELVAALGTTIRAEAAVGDITALDF
jgi:Mg-chelatase subunit ChlD